jgi:tetratricopeptide (TPR) repeat protein
MKQIIWILTATLLLAGCGSSKKLLQRGEYYTAVMESVRHLRTSPENTKQQDVLLQAYPLLLANSQRKINQAMELNASGKYSIAADEYLALNRIADAIYTCPKALQLIPQPAQYSRELNETLPKAAEEAYQLGESRLRLNTIQGAREAYLYFVKAGEYVNDYRDVSDKIAEALEMAIFKVIVQKPLTSQRHQLSSDFFYNNLMAQISQTATKGFVRFYTEEEARQERLTRPDHYISLDFENFSVGNMRESKNTVELTRDSVLVGTTTVNGRNQNVYGQVKAEFTTFRREVIAEGVLSAKIINASNNRIEQHQNFPGKFVWINEWANYKGDERALTDAQKRTTNTEPVMPPPQQDLFIEFTKPIFDQTVRFVNNYYSKYK